MYIFRIGLEGMIHLAKGDLKECEDVGQLFAFYDVCFFYLFHIYIYIEIRIPVAFQKSFSSFGDFHHGGLTL